MRLTYARIAGMSYTELAQLCIQLLSASGSTFTAEEEPEIWLLIVNDTQFESRIRALCLFQFF